jgi:ADP-ribosylglycohydrolase
MKLSFQEYKNKVEGCWLGKNIGGTLGAPLECKRGVFDYDFYSQDLQGEPMPNDDLDLQLIWLNGVEKYGRKINSSIMGEYWQQYIVPNWSEYGVGKSNMRAGLVPPLSGFVNNKNRNSCGAFIRSEIWACLAPGHPEIAVEYALEDAVVDHSYEGAYGEVFFAAIQSAAFVESDKFSLINIGLSYIPKDCALARAVRLVLDSYNAKMDWKELRKKILQQFPTTFGMMGGYQDREPEQDVPFGDLGFDAPANVAITILGWLYGEDDFGDSLLKAVNCGEDADCTGATLGAILGIIHGKDKIPEKWSEPIGRNIKTISLNLADSGVKIPTTIDELTDRVVKQTPYFLGQEFCNIFVNQAYELETRNREDLFCQPKPFNSFAKADFLDRIQEQPFKVRHECQLFSVLLDYHNAPFIEKEGTKKFTLTIDNTVSIPQWLEIKWHLPKSWEINPGKNMSLSLEHYHGTIGRSEAVFEIETTQVKKQRYDLIIEISSRGRHTKLLIPITLLTGNQLN